MRTLAILSRKGGTGKTTVSLHLAMAAWLSGRGVLLADCDRQGSAQEWRRERQVGGPVVFSTKTPALFATQQAAHRAGRDLMIIDTSPSASEDLAEAVRCADFCLMVLRPSFLDVRAIRETAELVARFGKAGAFVINQAPPRRAGREMACVGDTVAQLSGLGRPIMPIGLRARIAYQSAVAEGRSVQETAPQSAAALEIGGLWRAVEERLWPAAVPAVAE
ncbi:MAG: chromosome partitioning protein ParA [Caulobacter sp.]|nr:chromosome partitioning protein ParA [Caulobacter sp.]